MPRSLLSLFVLAFASTAPAQTTWYVDVSGTPPGSGTQTDPFVSLQAAIAQTATLSGDTISVAPGTYSELVNYVGKTLDVQSSGGSSVTILDGGGAGSVVTVAAGEGAGTRLAGFTIRGGTGTDTGGSTRGGGLYAVGSTLALEDCIVELNSAALGAGGYFEGTLLTADACTFADNTLETYVGPCGFANQNQGGGFHASSGTSFTFTAVDLLRNVGLSCVGAGAVILNSTGTWNGGLVSRNRADTGFCLSSGGGLYVNAANIELDQVTFEENTAPGIGTSGGGIYAISGFLTVRDCLFDGNRAGEPLGTYFLDFPGWGGGIRTEPGVALTVLDSTFLNNLAWLGGGAINAVGADVQDCFFAGNTSQFGGAVNGSGTYARCQFRTNVATSPSGTEDFGGAVYGVSGLTLVQCLLEDNIATGPGGAVWDADVLQSTLRRNSATRGGGAIHATLDGCLVRKNDASQSGGGLESCSAVNTVLFDNSAGQFGGGAHASTLDRCSLSLNDASSFSGPGEGGGVTQGNVTNSVVWQNTPDNVAIPGVGSPFGSSFVDWSDVEGGFSGTGNFDLDPVFWQPLAGDLHLQPGSPCIDTGDPGQTDPDGSRTDVGAFPFDPAWCPQAVTFCTPKTNSQGCAPVVSAGGFLDGQQPFTVKASMVINQKTGLFFYGLQGRSTIPFLGGTLCAKPPVRRTPLLVSGGTVGPDDCSGTYSFDLAGWIAGGNDPTIGIGTVIVGQFWYRDPADSQGTGLTNAFEAVVCQ